MTYKYVVVAVPARDEAPTIAECLQSIDAAAEQTNCCVVSVIAADTCVDGTASIARCIRARHSRLVVIDGAWGCVGAARAEAVAAALAYVEIRLDRVWIANTDADCVVPPDWLSLQLELGANHHAVGGIVELDPVTSPVPLLAAFHEDYGIDGDLHSHVHGANLGLRADAYVGAGGWSRTAALGEDCQLWAALAGSGRPVLQTTAVRVKTSARTVSRVEGGFATHLANLPEATAVCHV